jgi:S1-C subfamily serine protease
MLTSYKKANLLQENFEHYWSFFNKLHVVSGYLSQHQFIGSPAPPADANKDDCKCCKGCLRRNSIANAVSAVAPAVVHISVSQGLLLLHIMSNTVKMLTYKIFVLGLVEKGIGSGTIIDPDGTILTCAHVVTDLNNGKAYGKGNVCIVCTCIIWLVCMIIRKHALLKSMFSQL